jgi:hypothetical protein
MPQVQLNTRVDIDTYNRLKEASEKLNKSIASIVNGALNQYLKEASPMKKSCESCGKEMDKYSAYGKEYRICDECAAKLPDPMDDMLAAIGITGLKSDKEASPMKKLIGTINTGDSRMSLYAVKQGGTWQVVDGEGNDTEVSGKTFADTVRAACTAWSDTMKPAGAHLWDLELSDEAEKALAER